MTNLRVANNKLAGFTVIYVPSTSTPGKTYSIAYIRRNGRRFWNCQCQDFFYNKLPFNRHCRHLRRLTLLVKKYGGIIALTRAIKNGTVV